MSTVAQVILEGHISLMGAVAQLELGISDSELNWMGINPASLKRKAAELYEVHHSLLAAESDKAIGLGNGIQAPCLLLKICELGLRKPYEIFDLCVEVVDLWIGEGDNDRLTVTDYTRNVCRRPALDPVQPLLLFHTENGGRRDNWEITSHRLITLYISQPILKTAYRQIIGSEGTPNAHDLRSAFERRRFLFSQVTLRVRANGTIYGFLECSGATQDHGDECFTAETGYEEKARVMLIEENDPMAQPIIHAQESYRAELNQ